MGPITRALEGCMLAVLLFAGPSAIGADLQQDPGLVAAARGKDLTTLQSLLETKQVDVNSAQADGATALAWAVYHDDVKAINLLIDSGADVNAANDYGVTPLALACDNKSIIVVQKLLASGADPNRAMLDGATPLVNCINTGSVEAVMALLAHGADVNIQEKEEEQTPLMWAAAGKHSEIVRALVERGADINARSKLIPEPEPFIIPIPGDTVFGTNFDPAIRFEKTSGGFTPLHFAAQQGDIKSAQILLKAEADIDSPHPEHGSPLIIATASGHEDMALFLLEQGANPNVKDGWGITPLHYAVHDGLLILSGMTPLPTDDFGWKRPNMPKLLKALLERGADPEARIEYVYAHTNNLFLGRASRQSHDAPQVSPVGATPLLLAAASGDVESMRVLVEGGADPKATTVGGGTVFMLAAGMGSESDAREEKPAIDAAKYALAIGGGKVNDYLTDKALDGGPKVQGTEDRRTALHFAAFLGWRDMIRFLAEKGADLDATDRYGMTPLMIAMGDPEGRHHNQLGDRKHDNRYRLIPYQNKGQPAVVKTLLEAGATPFTGIYRDRAGE